MLAHDGAAVRDDDAAGATHRGNALLLGIEVDHDARVDLGLVERLGAHQAGLLVGGEDALERGMHERIVIEHGEHERHGDAVVGAQGGAVGGQDAVLTTKSMPSFSKSCSTPASLSHTMSMWPWSMTAGAPSAPALAGFLMITLYTSSW